MADIGDVLNGATSLSVALVGVVVAGVVAAIVAGKNDPLTGKTRHRPPAPLIEWAVPDKNGGYVVGA